ncbi:probable E3 ubiquitin-protein ligase DTX3 isoform X2 [Lampris incognitus]|uniref:probable E3 ubiquitin-protein ligase DTX3 isoform X2 n=1 Tax=Lampris incognitus TaxID=2546036 RepID=UPI0024B59E92|nr:probable E3 ubiquitin-protein ligase DTX3 isoform X2 [Lampris incognitus]
MEDALNAQSHHGADNGAAETDTCAVCLDAIHNKKTLKCRHSFCNECIDLVFRSKPACPICNTYHGVYTGTQPEGTMTVTRNWCSLPGFENSGTIVIQYHFPAGTQGPEHPNPGVRYAGTLRTAFLPASKQGEKVLRLLRKAFDRRLVFTIGRSATTGANNAITWNDIHHKTTTEGGLQCFGYPDPTYLQRVEEELRLNGVVEDD